MALFNNISFNFGFFNGMSNWLTPSFWNPVGWNIFSGWNQMNVFGSMMQFPFVSSVFEYFPLGNIGFNSRGNFTPAVTNTQNLWNTSNFSGWGNFTPVNTQSFWSVPSYSNWGNIDAFTPTALKKSRSAAAAKTNNTKVSHGSSKKSNSSKLYSKGVTGRVDHSYVSLTKSQALAKAKNDSNLEDLSSKNNSGWQLKNTFETDIPFAKKGTAKILQKAYDMTGIKLYVSSALGTAGSGNGSPHKTGNGYASHHNAENPKLDISYTTTSGASAIKGMSPEQFKEKLRATGLFSWILVEGDHLDVQIDPAAYKEYA